MRVLYYTEPIYCMYTTYITGQHHPVVNDFAALNFLCAAGVHTRGGPLRNCNGRACRALPRAHRRELSVLRYALTFSLRTGCLISIGS